MERFCGSLLPAIKSRRYPYASIDRRVTELSQLHQIKIIYGLRQELDLRKRRDVERNGMSIPAYPNSVFVAPSETREFSKLVYDRLVNHVATRFEASRPAIRAIIPERALHWGKIQWLNDGDMMHALDFIRDPDRRGRRDMTFVKYTVLEDSHFHQRNRRPAGIDVVAAYYGQLQSLFIVDLPPSPVIGTTENTKLALAAVLPIRSTGWNKAQQLVCRAGEFDPLEVIDIQSLESVVGRIIDRGKWIFIEQLGAREVTQIGDDPESAKNRLEKLARWRIDPSWIEFSKGALNFEGGNAIVSKAHLFSASDDTRHKFVGSSVGTLRSNHRTSNADGNNQRRGAEGSDQEGKSENRAAADKQDRESDSETFEWRKAVALKKMKLKAEDDVVRVLGLALREAEFLVNLSHENIIKLEGFIEDVSKEAIWLVFPWEDNGTLKDFVAVHDWDVPERISLIFDVTRGVEYLHNQIRPICHGDLKSINILVNSECRAVIIDFGSAHRPVAKGPNKESERAIEEPQSTPSLEATFCASTNTITLTCKQFTVRWAAPELLESDESSLASDVWALGWVVYEVMTNSIPFHDVKEPKAIHRIVRGDLPSISNDARMLLVQELCSVVGRCWNIDPTKRPAAKDCRNSISWMPMIAPNPLRTTDAAGVVDRSAELLMKLGFMSARQSDYSSAAKYYAKALGVYTDLADSKGKANALNGVAHVQRYQQDYSQAEKSYTEALKMYTNIGDRRGRADALWGLAAVHGARSEYSQAVTCYTKDRQIRTEIGDRKGSAYALLGLAEVHRFRKEYSQAMKFYSDAVTIFIDINDKFSVAFALRGIADTHRAQNDLSSAIHHYEEAAEIFKHIGNTRNETVVLQRAANIRLLMERQVAT